MRNIITILSIIIIIIIIMNCKKMFFSYDWKNNQLKSLNNIIEEEEEDNNIINKNKIEIIKDTSYLLNKNQDKNKYIFTVDWFSNNIPIWSHYLQKYMNKPNLNFLEIGSFQGRSTVWLLENILTNSISKITCIDTFEGSIEHTINYQEHIKNLYDVFKHNISDFKDKVIIKKNKSQIVLRQLEDSYDFIYIDGDHKASSVLEDAVLSFPLLKNGGIMIFDDYLWFEMKNHIDNPKCAIDAFLEIYDDKIKVLHKEYQVIIEKL
jgi:predicted O-methyltransferase YrrM